MFTHKRIAVLAVVAALATACGDKENCSDTGSLREALVEAKTGSLTKLATAVALFDGREWKTPEGRMLGDGITDIKKFLTSMDAPVTTSEARDQRDYDLKSFKHNLDALPDLIGGACK